MTYMDFNYDVFLSHNGKDKPAVEHIARLLRDEYEQKVWLDKWNLVPGEPWQDSLEDALDECQTFAVFLGPSGLGPWENEEMRSAIEDRVSDKNRRVIPVLLPDAPDNKELQLPRFLRRSTWVDFRSGLDDEEALYRLYCGITGRAPGDRVKAVARETSSKAGWHLVHPYPMLSNFTGRIKERQMLSKWLNEDRDHPLLIVHAQGGFGKSALTWQWLMKDVKGEKWPKVFWWSFYEADTHFEKFLISVLKYLSVKNVDQMKPSDQVKALVDCLYDPGIIIFLDGFERALRGYGSMSAAYQGDEYVNDRSHKSRECISLYSSSFLASLGKFGSILKSKVIMTTRLIPRSVEINGELLDGCYVEKLYGMNEIDAVDFFRAAGIKGSSAEIISACKTYDFHPLCLRILAGIIVNNRENPGDISIAKSFKVKKDIKHKTNHLLMQAFQTLTSTQQELLGWLACFRTPVKYDVLAKIYEHDEIEIDLDETLQVLDKRSMLHWDKKYNNNKYDLHPLVRQFAYGKLTNLDRVGKHNQIKSYFASIAKTEKVMSLTDLEPVIELYHHTVRAGNEDEARLLFSDRLKESLYFHFGAYQTIIELLSALIPDDEKNLPRLKGEDIQAWTMDLLATSYSLNGQPHQAIRLYERVLALDEKSKVKSNIGIATTLGNIADDQMRIGAIRYAEKNLLRRIKFCRKLNDEFGEGVGRQSFGHLLAYRGLWDRATEELEYAQEIFHEANNIQSMSVVMSFQAMCAILQIRDANRLNSVNPIDAIHYATNALRLAKRREEQIGRPNARDVFRAEWLLGAAHHLNGDFEVAEKYLSYALTYSQSKYLVDRQANVLLDLARLRYDQKNFEEAKYIAEEALAIAERCSYVLQGADVNLFLAKYELEQAKDRDMVKVYAENARKLAMCDGPPYYFKVAYEEAERILELL